MRRAGIGLIAGIALLVGIAAPHSAAAPADKVTLELSEATGNMFGEVKSRRVSCLSGRKAKLFHDAPGAPRKFEKLDGAETASDGSFAFRPSSGEFPAGRYYAKVKYKENECDEIKSQTLNIQPH